MSRELYFESQFIIGILFDSYESNPDYITYQTNLRKEGREDDLTDEERERYKDGMLCLPSLDPEYAEEELYHEGLFVTNDRHMAHRFSAEEIKNLNSILFRVDSVGWQSVKAVIILPCDV
jgi:hypothetical protein